MRKTAIAPVLSGRPKDPEKRLAILRAARQLFFERGFQAVSIEGIAVAAGVARMTVYGHFPDKETLFGAVVSAQGAAIAEHLSSLAIGRELADGDTHEKLRTELIGFGIELITFLSHPETRAFNRLVEAEACSHPTLSHIFKNAGPRPVMRALARRIEIATGRGLLTGPTRCAPPAGSSACSVASTCSLQTRDDLPLQSGERSTATSRTASISS